MYYNFLTKRLGFKQFNYHFNVSLKNKYIYCEVSKAACTTLKRFLLTHEISEADRRRLQFDEKASVHQPPGSSILIKPYQLGESLFDRLVDDEEFLKFSFVRNPYIRTLSAYLEKIVRGTRLTKTILPRVASQRLCDCSDVCPETITFLEFCRALKAMNKLSDFDQHWRPQARHIGFEHFPYAFIGKVETLDDDLPRVAKHIGSNQRAIRQDAHKTDSATRVNYYYCDESMSIVQEVFKDDFYTFNYEIGRIPNLH